MPQINLIYARAANNVIGHRGALPWHLPEDLAHFKRLTMGHPVIMGRKTWDSLPARFRPLPGRVNVVITRQRDWTDAGALPASGFDEAITLCHAAEEVWVIGGEQIFALAEPRASRIEITEIDAAFEGDAFAPALGPQWVESSRQEQVSAQGLRFRFCTLLRHSMAG